MFDAPLALGFAAGLLAAFNPCGFAMLPAYISFFLGSSSAGPAVGVGRSLAVGGAMSLGFVAVFGTAGLIVSHLSSTFKDATPYVTVVVGLGVLVPLGVAYLLGRQVNLRLPRLHRGGSDEGLASMVVFGVSYATISLSCGLGPFLAAVTGTFREGNLAGGLAVFGAFVAGMSAVLMSLTLALGLARRSMVARLRSVLPYVHRVSGALMVTAGLYVAYYGWYSIRLLDGDDVPAGPVAFVERASDEVARFVTDTGETRLGAVLAAFVVVAAVGAWRRRSTRRA
ncbi:MAG: cytochrome c biogenesis CcdA family protein [Acidimicrobiia bacterium]